MKNKLIIILTVLFVIMSFEVSASVVGASPSIIRLERMLKGGYAESKITITTSFENPIGAGFSKEGDVANWITFTHDNDFFNVSKSDSYSTGLIIEPPLDTPTGNYTGTIKITTNELGRVNQGAGSSILAQVAILLYIEVIGEEVVECRAGAIYTSNSEKNDPFLIHSVVNNDGNVRLRPEIFIEVYDQYETKLMMSKRLLGTEILPTLRKEFFVEVDHELPVGQYFAKIIFDECDVIKKTTFDILEKGQISDSGQLIGINSNEFVIANEPMLIVPFFRNNGDRKVLAKFQGEIRNLKNDKIVQVLESEELEVNPTQTIEFKMIYTPTKSGEYQISGRVKYNNKLTFDEKSKIVNVKGSALDFDLKIVIYVFLYIIVGLVILILIGMILKEKRKKNRRKRIF